MRNIIILYYIIDAERSAEDAGGGGAREGALLPLVGGVTEMFIM